MSGPLPTERDFNPRNSPTDAAMAWQNFGGLTLDEAYAKFCEHPMYYQEDFMFMGGIAFAYYFPVIETYIRNAPDTEPFGDHEAWILAKGIEIQFSGDNLAHVRHLKDRVVTLANFVHENIDRFGDDGEERQRVADAWCELVGHIAAGDEPA